jgi:LEA14-like dessication related protein
MKWSFPLFLSMVLFASCKKVKEPEFRRLENFKVKDFGFSEVTIGLNVTYYNPNGFKVSVKEAAIDVYIDSVYLGKFTQDSPVQVSQNAEFSIPVTGLVPTATALKLNFKDIDSREILLEARGSVRVGKGGIFVNKDINYSGHHKLSELKLGDFMGR